MRRPGIIACCIVLLSTYAASTAIALEAKIKIAVVGRETPTIFGVTNLPDESSLLVSLRRGQADYFAQAHAKVELGRFAAGPFSQNRSGIPPGDYEIEIVFPLSHTQSPSVRQQVGEQNEKLKGPLVSKSKFGVTAVYVETVNIGGAASAVEDRRSRQTNELAMRKWRRESCEWIARIARGAKPVEECIKELER